MGDFRSGDFSCRDPSHRMQGVDAERCTRLFLHEQRDIGKLQRTFQQRFEDVANGPPHTAALSRRDAARQHHLEAEFIHHVRVAPSVQIGQLRCRKPVWIGALDIGTARDQSEVMARVRRFLPDVAFDCDPSLVSGNVGPVECGATLNPGWVEIGFDHDGRLLRVRFDGYQFI